MSYLPDKPVEISIMSCPGHLPIVRAALSKTCELIGFDEECCGAIILAADEALTNIIRHAYHGREDQPIKIEFNPLDEPENEGVVIRIRDFGMQVDPSKIKSRDLDDVRPGGLGVHIMNECMDDVRFAPCDDGGTVLIMTKKLPSMQEADL